MTAAHESSPTRVAVEIAGGGGLSLSQAARRIPPARKGRPVHVSTLWRWATHGVLIPDGRRVRLEIIRLAGRLVTSEGALARFLAAQAPTEGVISPPAPGPRGPTAEQAERELEMMGI
jgi:hypothetical protein